MPYRPKTPCHHPGCPELVEAARLSCETHQPLHPEVTRPAAKRGYHRAITPAAQSWWKPAGSTVRSTCLSIQR